MGAGRGGLEEVGEGIGLCIMQPIIATVVLDDFPQQKRLIYFHRMLFFFVCIHLYEFNLHYALCIIHIAGLNSLKLFATL